MAANAIPRQNLPRFTSDDPATQFMTWRAQFYDFFLRNRAESPLPMLAEALGVQLEIGTPELEPTFPIALPRVGFREHIDPMTYRRYAETRVKSSPKTWSDGASEDLRRLLAPGPNMFRDMNFVNQWSQAALDTVEQKWINVLLAGVSGTHEFDSASFFGVVDVADKLINPKWNQSRSYKNHISLTLDTSDPMAFANALEQHFWTIPTPGQDGFLKLELAAIVTGNTAHTTLRNLYNNDRIEVRRGPANDVIEVQNTWRGRVRPIRTTYLPANKALAFARGASAGIPFAVHTLTGVEMLPGGDFFAGMPWEQQSGTPMRPLISWTPPPANPTELVENNEIKVKAAMDFAVTPMCPWSVALIDLTIL